MASGRPAIVTSLKRDDVVILNRDFDHPFVVSAITEDREARIATLMPFPAGQALNVPPVHYLHDMPSNSYVRLNDGINVGKGKVPNDLYYGTQNEGAGTQVVKMDKDGNIDRSASFNGKPDIFDAFGFQLDPTTFVRMNPNNGIAPTRYLRWPTDKTGWRSQNGMPLGGGAVPNPVLLTKEDVAASTGYTPAKGVWAGFADLIQNFEGLFTGNKRPLQSDAYVPEAKVQQVIIDPQTGNKRQAGDVVSSSGATEKKMYYDDGEVGS